MHLPGAEAECAGQFDAQQGFRDLIQEMEVDYQTLEQNYKGVSLFIESLFRSSHFQKGHLVLRRRTCRVHSEIIQPQLQLFLPKLQERRIDIDTRAGVMPDEDLPLSVDKGLMAQVYANLFSNAVKYARRNQEGRKYMAYGRDLLKDYFGPGKDGVKFSVFTTGPISRRRTCPTSSMKATAAPISTAKWGRAGASTLCATSSRPTGARWAMRPLGEAITFTLSCPW